MATIGNIQEGIDIAKELIEQLKEKRPLLKKELEDRLIYLNRIPSYLDAAQDHIVQLTKTISTAPNDGSTSEADSFMLRGLEILLEKMVNHWNSEVEFILLKLNRWNHEKVS